MSIGTVKWFNATKGYGFIQPQGGGQDVFVHISAVERAGLSTLNEGQQVEYEVVSNRGKSGREPESEMRRCGRIGEQNGWLSQAPRLPWRTRSREGNTFRGLILRGTILGGTILGGMGGSRDQAAATRA